jgi:hypothetical protein
MGFLGFADAFRPKSIIRQRFEPLTFAHCVIDHGAVVAKKGGPVIEHDIPVIATQ